MFFKIKKKKVSLSILSYQYSDILRVIRWFHRDSSRYIAFASKGTGEFIQLGSVLQSKLEKEWKKLSPFLKTDGYFSINDFHSAKSWMNHNTGLSGVNRTGCNVHNLNSCYVDLDVGRRNSSTGKILTVESAREKLAELVSDRIIPKWSGRAKSGRGIYVFWRLADSAGRAIHADWQSRELYQKIQKALVLRLECLFADPNAMDSSRVLRVPGTEHGLAGKKAKYYLREFPVYTLEELANFLGIGRVNSKPNVMAGAEAVPARRNGLLQLNSRRAADILKLEAHRGGFREGTRRRAIRYFIQFMRGGRIRRKDALEQAENMAMRCKPIYPVYSAAEAVDEMVNEIYSAEKFYFYSNQRIVGDLRITDRECIAAKLNSILTVERVNHQKSERTAERISKRRKHARLETQLQRALMKNRGMSGKAIAAFCERRGHLISRQTALRWKKKLAIGA